MMHRVHKMLKRKDGIFCSSQKMIALNDVNCLTKKKGGTQHVIGIYDRKMRCSRFAFTSGDETNHQSV